jgi:hypothetical protein
MISYQIKNNPLDLKISQVQHLVFFFPLLAHDPESSKERWVAPT